MFTSHDDFSDLTPTQYEAAYAWLAATGLLDDVDSATPASSRVFRASILRGGTPWLRDADDLVRTPEELPGDAASAAEALDVSPEMAFAHVRTLWGKVDTAERERVGAAAESAMVELLRSELTASVDHVAAAADGFGYDVAVHAPSRTLHVEVKGTTRRSRLRIYLSRNEYDTMRRDPAWILVAVRLNSDLRIAAVATVDRNWIGYQAPSDRGASGRWESCRLEVPAEAISPGMPSIWPMARDSCSTLLMGDVVWPGP